MPVTCLGLFVQGWMDPMVSEALNKRDQCFREHLEQTHWVPSEPDAGKVNPDVFQILPDWVEPRKVVEPEAAAGGVTPTAAPPQPNMGC